MDFNQDYFEIFGLPRSFEVDRSNLDERYHQLQKAVHPDRYADATETERRRSVQWATQVNTAYDTLKADLPRAIYLLELAGVEIEHNPAMNPMFLMEQIELREELEALESAGGPLEALDDFKGNVKGVMKELFGEFDGAYQLGETTEAEQFVYKLQFINKLIVAADHVEEKLLDY